MTITLWTKSRTMTQDRHAPVRELRVEILRCALDHAFPLRVLDTILDRMEQDT
jgi:hypothetical protein